MGSEKHLLLSPHNLGDDEALFASYVCLRHRPRVVTVLDGSLKKHGPRPWQREAESAAAMEILDCEYAHLGFPNHETPWDKIEERLREEREPDRVWAPLPEPDGHRHHNRVAWLAVDLWPGRVSFYSTYHCDDEGWPHRSVVGEPVPVEDAWPDLKREALACYRTQIMHPGTAMHFTRPMDEYVVPGLRLNLGGGINPIPGFVNIDKTSGWMFEDGLPYPDRSVEAITESHALMYVALEDWPFVFSEIARVLVPGGTLRMTHDNIGGDGSSRPVIRPRAAVATTSELVLEHMAAVGLDGAVVDPDMTSFSDRSLIQKNYGIPPDVFHVEAVSPVRVKATA